MTLRSLVLKLALSAPACAAWRLPATVQTTMGARSAVGKLSSVSMVQWERAPTDTLWANAAWDYLGLSTQSLGSECYVTPDGFAPGATRQWYFCSLEGAQDGWVTCLELPTYMPSNSVFICSTPKGARPGYSE